MTKKILSPSVTGSVKDALRLGCSAVGLTIYPGSTMAQPMYEELREIAEEAKAHGLAVVIWSYPRGSSLSKEGETALDVVAYAAQIAAQLGANIIKVELPSSIELAEAKKVYTAEKIALEPLSSASVTSCSLLQRPAHRDFLRWSKGDRRDAVQQAEEFTKAAATARSSGATVSNGRRPKRLRCSTRSSTFTRASNGTGRGTARVTLKMWSNEI